MAGKKNKIAWPILLVGLILAAAMGTFFYFTREAAPSVKIYFLKDEKLIGVIRPLPKNADQAEIAAAELISGPNEEERQDGVFSEIPKGTKIEKVSISGGTASVYFNNALEAYGGGSARVQRLVAQIVYTFTELPGVKNVKIIVGGKDETVLGGEGFVIDKPLSRDEVKL